LPLSFLVIGNLAFAKIPPSVIRAAVAGRRDAGPTLAAAPRLKGQRQFFSFPRAFAASIWLRPRKAGFLGAPNSGGVLHKAEDLSNRRGVPGVRGEEI
jgi:hypothetical protein